MNKVESFFQSYGLHVKVSSVVESAVFCTIKLTLKGKTRLTTIERLRKEMSLLFKGHPSIRVLPDEGVVALDIPKRGVPILHFDPLQLEGFPEYELPCLIGEGVDGPFAFDLVEAPHVLIAGTTGSGKTSLMQCIIRSIIDKVDLMIVDPKRVDYPRWDGHLYRPRMFTPEETVEMLHFILDEVIAFHLRLLEVAGCSSWQELRRSVDDGESRYPYLVLIIDECADLLLGSGKEVELLLCKVAQISRAVGVHLILATQRPSHDVLTGRIKANFPYRIALKTASGVDSRVIGVSGAELLRGKGDMLVGGGERVQGYLFKGVVK